MDELIIEKSRTMLWLMIFGSLVLFSHLLSYCWLGCKKLPTSMVGP